MKNLLLLVVLIFTLSSGMAQKASKIANKLSGDLGKDISMIFGEGEVEVELIGVNPKLQELSLKMALEVQKEPNWYIEYLAEYPMEKTRPYHENLGISKEEYGELQSMKANPAFATLGKEKIKSTKFENQMTFVAEGDLDLFNKIEVNLDSNFIEIDNERLLFVRAINVDSAENGFGSKWKGNNYETEIPASLLTNPADFYKMDSVQYKMTIGQIEKDGKYLIQISGLKMKAGRREGILLNLLI